MADPATDRMADDHGRRGPHLLTVLHAAEHSGPPLFALQFLRWLRAEHPDWKLSTLFLDAGGLLVPEFEELGTVVLANGQAPYSNGRRRRRRLANRFLHGRLRLRLRKLGPIDVAHVHCAGSLRVLPALPSVPVLGHLHELSVGLDLHLGPIARDHIGDATRYVAVSEGVRQAFLERVPVAPDLVDRQWGFVEPGRLPEPGGRARVGLAPDAFVVASSGVRHWRKAPELFIRVAQAAARQAPEVPWRFVWVGGHDDSGLEALVEQVGLSGLVTFLPHQPHPLDWIEAADVFVLPAREDAFPLVCVEAAAIGRPIVTFDNGGAAELVTAAGCGEIVPFPDVEALAAVLVRLARDPAARDQAGTAARSFAHQHLLLDQAGPKLHASIEATRTTTAPSRTRIDRVR